MKLGIKSPVSRMNTSKERPRFTTSSTNRSDWVSQISAVSPAVTAINDQNS